MGIKNYIMEFQDYFYLGRSYLESLSASDLTAASLEAAYEQTESILESFKENLEFLDVELVESHKEVDDAIKSIYNKIEKINFYAEAIKTINTTTEDKENILSISPYELKMDGKTWEGNSKCLMLEPKSSYITINPYSTTSYDSYGNKGVNKYLLKDTFSTRYIVINKENIKVNNVICFNNARELLESVVLNEDNNSIITIPNNTTYLNIEYENETPDNDFSITPLSFYHFDNTIIPLESFTYTTGDLLTFSINKEIPYGCYVQILLDITAKDINNNIVLTEKVWYSVDNDGLVVLKKDWIEEEEVKRVWKKGTFKEVSGVNKLSNDDYVLCKPKYGVIKPYTESSFLTNIKNSKQLIVKPTLYMFSLSNETLTPRIYSIIGISKRK